jgi:hypothetical protein
MGPTRETEEGPWSRDLWTETEKRERKLTALLGKERPRQKAQVWAFTEQIDRKQQE